MSASVTVREVGGIAIIDLHGRFTNLDAKDLLLTTTQRAAETSRSILLNLADVSYIDSSVLGEMVGAYVSITKSGGEIKLLNVHKRFQHLLQITRLDSIFETFDDEATAAKSFGTSKKPEQGS